MDLKDWDWSKPITKVVVGQEKTTFHVHSDALSCKSPVWKSRLDGTWKDDGRFIDWTEFDIETIRCVLSFLYTGNYDPANKKGSRVVQTEAEPQPPHALNDPAATTNGVTGSSAQDDQKHPESSARDESPVSLACTPGELLIAHSKVYIFAVQFLCSELKELALQRLTQVFGSADPKASDVLSGLSEAIILIYDKTQEQISAAEPARALLMNFLAQYLEYLDDVGTLLLLESQELIGDLVQETLKRATTAERTVEELSEEGAHKDKKLQKLKSSRCKRCRSHASPELESQEWS